MAALPAHLVATPVLERLTGSLDGMVLGAGATAAWVEVGGFVVAVTTREVPLLPNAVALGAGSGALLRPGLAAGSRARLAPGRVDLGVLQVTWDPAAPPSWDPTVRVPRAAGPEAIAGRAAALRGAVGAVDSHGRSPPERATLPLRGPQQRRVGFPRAPAGVPAGNGDVRVGPGSPADLALAGNGDVRVGPEGPAGLALAGEGDAPAGEGRPLGEGGSQAAAHSPEVPLADAG